MDGENSIRQDLRHRVASSPFHHALGIDVVEATEGFVRLAMDAREDQRNLQGTVHGGIVATLADTAMGFAVRTSNDERRHVTIDLGVHYLRAAHPGTIEAVGTVVRAGATITYAEADVLDADGRLLARAHGTYSVVPAREVNPQ